MQQANRSWQGLNGAGEREEAGGGAGSSSSLEVWDLAKGQAVSQEGSPTQRPCYRHGKSTHELLGIC